jgi:hypothetical protein
MFCLSSVAFFLNARSGFLRFFNLYDKSRPENLTKRGEIDFFRTISKVLVYVLCSKRIDFRAILRNTLGTPNRINGLFDSVCLGCLFLRSPSRIPYRTELIPCAKRAASVILLPESGVAEVTHLLSSEPGSSSGPKCLVRKPRQFLAFLQLFWQYKIFGFSNFAKFVLNFLQMF